MYQKVVLSLIICLLSNVACSSVEKKPELVNPNTAVVSTNENPTEKSADSISTEAIPIQQTEKNLLSLSSGAFLLRHPPSFGFWSVMLIDGSDSFWISPGGKGQNQIFIIAMPAETVFKSFSFVKGDDYYGEGSSAKDILIEVSNTDSKSGYQKVLETSLPLDVKPDQKFSVTAELPARFVRLTVKNSHKNPENVSLGEFRGYGTQKSENSPTGLAGTYHPVNHIGDYDSTLPNEGEYQFLTEAQMKDADSDSNISLKQEGTQIYGCTRNSDDNYFNGGLEGNVAQINRMVNKDEKPKKGVMSFSPDGKYMAYFEFNDENGFGDYKVYQKINNSPADCTAIKGFNQPDGAKNQLAEDLSKNGRAIIYGINFDFNSDKLRDESKIVLNKIVAVLKENADWKMRIEGHTDNVGGERYNNDLSEKRAAVKNYLASAGINASRLSSKGFGLSNPIAPNETETGRAQNRRVELVKE